MPRSNSSTSHIERQTTFLARASGLAFLCGWATKQSPIHIAELCRRYTAEIASYDGLHPNRLGDYQIAQSFAEAFIQKLKLGRDELHIPKTIPALELPAPALFRLGSSPFGVSATWQMGMRMCPCASTLLTSSSARLSRL